MARRTSSSSGALGFVRRNALPLGLLTLGGLVLLGSAGAAAGGAATHPNRRPFLDPTLMQHTRNIIAMSQAGPTQAHIDEMQRLLETQFRPADVQGTAGGPELQAALEQAIAIARAKVGGGGGDAMGAYYRARVAGCCAG